MRLKTRAMQTNTAGSTICRQGSPQRFYTTELFSKTCMLAYLSKEALPGASGVQKSFPHQSHKLLPPQTPAGHLK